MLQNLFISFAQDKEEADRVMSQVKILIRPLYSNPPIHGSRIVTEILSNPELKTQWWEQLDGCQNHLFFSFWV